MKAQGFLEQLGASAGETVNANKTRIGPTEAVKLLADVDRLIAARGKRVEVFDLTTDRPEDAVLLTHLLGPTGNLRAPTVRVGRTLLVGFNEEAYRQVLE